MAAAVLAGGVAWASAPGPEELDDRAGAYEATHTLYADEDAGSLPMALPTLELLARTGEVPERAAERVGYDGTGEELAGEVSVAADAELGTLRLSTTQPDAERAERYVDGYAAVVRRFVVEAHGEEREEALARAQRRREEQEQRLRELSHEIAALGGAESGHPDVEPLLAEREALRASYRETLARVERLEQTAGEGPGLVTLQEGAAVPVSTGVPLEAPASPEARAAAGGAIGLVAGLGLALIADRLDNRLRTHVAAERAVGLPVLAEVPRLWRGDPARLVPSRPASGAAEAFRMVRAGVQLGEQPVRTVLVTSAEHGAGRTATTANLAAAFAEAGDRVLCVDAEPASTALGRALLGGSAGPDGEAAGASRLCDTGLAGVSLLSLGTDARGVSRLSRPDRGLVRQLGGHADVVLIDAGPCLETNEPAMLMRAVDAVLVVVRSGRTTVELAERTAELLARSHAGGVGVVLNRVPRRLLSLRARPRGVALAGRGPPAPTVGEQHGEPAEVPAARAPEPRAHGAEAREPETREAEAGEPEARETAAAGEAAAGEVTAPGSAASEPERLVIRLDEAESLAWVSGREGDEPRSRRSRHGGRARARRPRHGGRRAWPVPAPPSPRRSRGGRR